MTATDFRLHLEQLLLSAKGKLDLGTLGPKGKTALRVGVESLLSIDHIQVLLKCGADPNAVVLSVSSTSTPTLIFLPTCLQYTVFHGQLEMAELLLEYGALVDWTGRSAAIHLAACSGNLNMVTLLLNHNARVELPDAAGRTALHIAAMQGHLEMTSLLLRRGADINGSWVFGFEGLCPSLVVCHHSSVITH